MAIVKTTLMVVNSIQLGMLGFGLIISKVLSLGLFMAEKVYLFLVPRWSNGREKTDSLEHEDFEQHFSCQLLERHVFFNISHTVGHPLPLALSLGEEVETVLQRHLLQAHPFLETGKDCLQKPSKVAEGYQWVW